MLVFVGTEMILEPGEKSTSPLVVARTKLPFTLEIEPVVPNCICTTSGRMTLLKGFNRISPTVFTIARSATLLDPLGGAILPV